MFNEFAIKVILSGILSLSFIPSVFSQTAGKDTYLPIDQVVERLEHNFSVRFFYKPEWFEKKEKF